MEDQIDDEIKDARRDAVMEVQQDIAYEHSEAQIGRVISCIVEGRIPEEGVLVARSYMDAPDVDGYVFIDTDLDMISGTPLTVEVIDAAEYDLIGRIVEDAD